MHLYLYHRGDLDQGNDSRRLVRTALKDYTGRKGITISDEDIELTSIDTGRNGKPFFADLKDIHFSVSHSWSLWGCLMTDEPVGFDMEAWHEREDRRNANYIKIARRYFTEAEYDLVLTVGREAFYDIWVRKEACVKYLGTSLAVGLGSLATVKDGKLVTEIVSQDEAETPLTCIIKPLEIEEGVKAAYCSASGNSIQAMITI